MFDALRKVAGRKYNFSDERIYLASLDLIEAEHSGADTVVNEIDILNGTTANARASLLGLADYVRDEFGSDERFLLLNHRTYEDKMRNYHEICVLGGSYPQFHRQFYFSLPNSFIAEKISIITFESPKK